MLAITKKTLLRREAGGGGAAAGDFAAETGGRAPVGLLSPPEPGTKHSL